MKSVHFIGIGGSGMSGLAHYCHEAGWKITGSDISSNRSIETLKTLGVQIVDNHETSLLRSSDVVVYSSAVSENNLERILAKELGIELLHRSEFLAHLAIDKKCIAVAGTHGKSTTSAMLVHIFKKIGLNPHAVIGAKMKSTNESHLLGSGDFFIIEADESDGSFLNYNPYAAVITNIGLDHLDHFHSIDGIKSSFKEFIGGISKEGGLVVGWDNQNCREVVDNLETNVISFGLKLGCDIRCLSQKQEGAGMAVDFLIERDRFSLNLPLLGRYNVSNAFAALGVCRLLGFNIKDCIHAIEGFEGVDRRMSVITSSDELTVIDDYAHNPDKIKACIDAVRERWPDRKIHVAFQPHRYSRLSSMWDDFCKSFTSSDLVYLFPVFEAGESKPSEFDLADLLDGIKTQSNINSVNRATFENITEIYDNNRSSKDIFLSIGAGDVFKVAHKIGENFGEGKEK